MDIRNVIEKMKLKVDQIRKEKKKMENLREIERKI